MGGCDRSVSAKIDFYFRRKPAQLVMSIAWNIVCGLGKVMFGRDGLKRGIRQPRFQRADCCGISLEGAAGESVDMINRDFHASTLPIPAAARGKVNRYQAASNRHCCSKRRGPK